MSPMTMKELAERVEAATGPDRELDAAIWLHLPEQEDHAWKHGGDKFAHAHQIAGCSFVPNLTASLDAAMSLVPEGRGLIYKRHGIKNVWRVQIHSGDETTFIEGDAATPALALCAAALKARASQETTR